MMLKNIFDCVYFDKCSSCHFKSVPTTSHQIPYFGTEILKLERSAYPVLSFYECLPISMIQNVRFRVRGNEAFKSTQYI